MCGLKAIRVQAHIASTDVLQITNLGEFPFVYQLHAMDPAAAVSRSNAGAEKGEKGKQGSVCPSQFETPGKGADGALIAHPVHSLLFLPG